MSVSLKEMKKNSLKLTRFLLAVCHEILYFPNGERLKRISDRMIEFICSHGAEGFDLQKALCQIKNKEYEIQFEQYLTYYLYFHYMKAVPDYDIMRYVAAAARTFEHGEAHMKKLREICEKENCTETAELLALLG